MADSDTNQAESAMQAAQSGMAGMLTMYRRQIDACRKVADLMLDATARLEQIGLTATRNALHGGLDAANGLGRGDGAMPSMSAPNAETLMQYPREIAETLTALNTQVMRVMSDYGSQVAQSAGASMGGLGAGSPFEAFTRPWSEAVERYNDMLRSAMPGRPG